MPTIDMQKELERIKVGHCILVKLINYDELCAIFSPLSHLINDLNKIIDDVCQKTFDTIIYKQIEHNKIFVILPKMEQKLLRQLVFEIYYFSQLYLNEDIPEAYMQCRFSSIEFSQNNKDAKEIYSILINMLSTNAYAYYCEYDKHIDSLKAIKEFNKKLNVLRKALIQKEIKFAYQPIIDRKTGRIPYYECLLRVPEEDGQLVSVGPIIAAAENKGLINVIDHIVLEMSIMELVSEATLSLSVNISNYGILDTHLLETAENLLTKYKVADRLIIEITETALNEDYQRTKLFMDKLHLLGCKFALDDFGTGFTSFKQLQNLPIDIIKIDGSYIRNITSNLKSQYFVELLVKISEDMGVKTVAEFVENGEIAKFLIDIKVDGMQGNFFLPASNSRD